MRCQYFIFIILIKLFLIFNLINGEIRFVKDNKQNGDELFENSMPRPINQFNDLNDLFAEDLYTKTQDSNGKNGIKINDPNKKSIESSSIEDEVMENKLFSRNKRFLTLATQPNKEYQQCLTPIGSKGHCKHVRHCSMSEFKQNFWQFLDYLCIIERFTIGVCCPDDVSDKIINLPTNGNNDQQPFDPINSKEDGDSPPIWGGGSNSIEDRSTEAILSRPEERGCGISTKSFPKITGGRPADPGEWPWMAALLRRGPPNAFCGGVLITDRHVLTAAHCTRKFRANEIFVRLGEYDFSVYNETRARDFRVIDIRQHLDFDESTYENDISILKLQRAAMFTSYIWPICMPPVGYNWDGERAVVTGWGTQFFGGPQSDVLMEVSMPIWSHRRCQESFTQRITDTLICAGAFEGGRDSCQGDSGGPLLAQLPNRRWVTIGIVSWGVRCGEANHPGIYTRVDAYSNWILENAVF